MKKILILFTFFLLVSCSQLTYIKETQELSAIDFREYSKKGFLITPEMYNGKYSSVGVIHYKVTPKAVYSNMRWIVDTLHIQSVLDGVYEICNKMGADALVNFKASFEGTYYSGISNPINLIGIEISGLAIKRED